MRSCVRDRIIGAGLLVFAAVWCAVTWITVPEAYGDAAVGPRDAPFGLGVLLGLLALAVIGQSWFTKESESQAPEAPAKSAVGTEWLAIGVVTASLLAYALLMEWFGFVVATAVVVFVLLRLALHVRSLPILIGMSVVMSFGVFFVMGTLMGVYLPHGTIISPF